MAAAEVRRADVELFVVATEKMYPPYFEELIAIAGAAPSPPSLLP